MKLYLSATRGIALSEEDYKKEIELEYEDFKIRGTSLLSDMTFEEWLNNNTLSKFYELDLDINEGSLIDFLLFDGEIKSKIKDIYNQIGLDFSDYDYGNKNVSLDNVKMYNLITNYYLYISFEKANDIVSEVKEVVIKRR